MKNTTKYVLDITILKYGFLFLSRVLLLTIYPLFNIPSVKISVLFINNSVLLFA